MSDNKALHRVIRRLARWAVWSFFSDVHVIGAENVPMTGPLIVVATHHNMMLDPAVLSSHFPGNRILNYWTKATLFANPVMKYILLSSGNIPVERKSKDNRVLFKGTFDVLSKGEAVALFPEGTSYTEPRIMQVKDGASWSALEYMKWAKENPDKAVKEELTVVPAAIVYTNKSKYRSQVIIEFAEPIAISDYEEQFLSTVEGEPRAAVKRLTKRIEDDLTRLTINAPDWDTMFMARMARSLLWEKSKSIDLNDFIPISQTLVDLFSTSNGMESFAEARRRLLEYYSLLQFSKLNNSALSALPLPKTLDPRRPEPLPSRLRTLFLLFRDTLSVLIRLPFFFVPLLVHFPAYIAARAAARLVEDEEETQAQNKVVFGLLFLLIIYPSAFFFLWALFLYSPIGAMVAAATVWLFAVYHVKIIDDNYEHAKQLVAAWRVLVGVWAPKRSELSLTALKQFTVPKTPPESQWIDKKKVKEPVTPGLPTPVKPVTTSVSDSGTPADPLTNGTKTKPTKHRMPTRRLVRHVLRARARAVHALSAFLTELEHSPKGQHVFSSKDLAIKYGGFPEVANETPETDNQEKHLVGWREAHEVLVFLRDRGARIATLESQIAKDYWAATASPFSDGEEEGETEYSSGNEELVWVPPATQ